MPTKTTEQVLVLPSWYPNKLDEFSGDFIQRHVRSIALYTDQYIIFVVKDKDAILTKDTCTDIYKHDNYTEQLIYYHSLRTGVLFLDRYLSHRKYKTVYKKAVREYIKLNGKPRLVHVHVAMKAGIIAYFIKKKFRIPYVVTEHWTGYFKEAVINIYTNSWFLKRLNKRVLQGAVTILPVTANLGHTINTYLVPIRYDAIPNVVDTDLFFYCPFNSIRFRFIHPSSMNFNKNPEGIIQACKIVKEKGYDFELLMVGALNNEVIEMAKKVNLYNTFIFIKPAIPYTEVAKEMQTSSALLLFSRYENLPCVILEALCCGLPVISTKVGGIAEVIHKENGILVEHENVEQLAEAMCAIIDTYNKYQPVLIAQNAAQQFNYNTIGKKYMDEYKNILIK